MVESGRWEVEAEEILYWRGQACGLSIRLYGIPREPVMTVASGFCLALLLLIKGRRGSSMGLIVVEIIKSQLGASFASITVYKC